MADNLASFRMYLASCTGNAQNTIYSIPFDVTSAEDLAAACRKDHVCTEFQDNRRGSKTFIRCHAIQADCDNDNTDDPAAWITPETVAARLPGVAFYAVKSRNCDKMKHPGEPGEKSARPRWHYYFPLRESVPKIHIIRAIMSRILVVFPEFDRDGMKPAQFFYGHAEPVAEYHPGEKDIAEFFVDHPEIKEPETARSAEPARNAAAASDDFFSQNVDDMLRYISADDYGTWVAVGNALVNAGQPFDIWDRWSRSSGKYPGETAAAKKWQSFRAEGADRTANAGTIVNMAKASGWKPDPDKLTGEYKENHEKAEYERKQREKFQAEHREENIAALAALGIDCAGDPYRFTWTLDFDGSIEEVTEKATGEIKYRKPDPEKLPTGETVNLANPAAAAPAEKNKHQLTVTGYDNVEDKPINFLFFPWFPRGYLVAIQGDSGTSKSTFLYAVGAKVSTGSDLLNVPCEDPGNVMFITIEDEASDIKISFVDAGGDLSKLFRIQEREEIARLNLSPDGIKMIDKIIKDKNIRFLVLDPIQQFLTGDMNKASETRPQMARLMNVAAENDICIAFTVHTGKDTTKSALHRGIGSVDIGASTRSMLQVVTDPEDDYYKILFTVKSNLAGFHDGQRAIRYQVKDHPGSYNQEKKKHERFRGHAEFTEILPEYNERLYRKASRKADEESEAEETLKFEYDDDPLVITAREIVSYNPDGLFIGTDDLISKITEACGRCPYIPAKDKTIGIYQRILKLRSLLIDHDGIQVDKRDGTIKPKAYNWRGKIFVPDDGRKVHGVYITPIRTGGSGKGAQQTKI